MRLNDERTRELRRLLKEGHDLGCTDEQAQEAVLVAPTLDLFTRTEHKRFTRVRCLFGLEQYK